MKKLNKFIIATLVLAFNICLLMFPAEVLGSAHDGLLLWFNRVLPSLLPFVIGINVLNGLGVIGVIGEYLSPIMEPLFKLPGAAGAALIAGLTSGYPVGAKTVAELTNNALSTEEAQRAAGFCNNAGPLFIVGFVGTSLFGDPVTGYKLLAAHILSAIILGIILGLPQKRTARAPKRSYKKHLKGIGGVLGDSVNDAMRTMLFLCGLIILFSVITRILGVLGIVNGLASGLLEITNGVKVIAAADSLDINMRLALTAGIISFGGLSVHAQAMHFLSAAGVKMGQYLMCKIAQGILAFFIMLAILYT